MTPDAGPRRATQTKPTAPAPRISDTSEVFDVDSSTSTRARPANSHHSHCRRGLSRAAAEKIEKAKAMLPPRAFFSVHRPRQAPGNSSVIMPWCGGRAAQAIEPSTSTALAAARISARVAQRNRTAMATPQRVVE